MCSRVDLLRFDSLSSFSGLLAIDLFCDHYSLISSPTTVQVNTCTAYYRNALEQPWYMSLVTLVPILIGTVVMLRNMTRSIYDMLSIPLFAGVLFAFVFRVKKYAGLLAAEVGTNRANQEEYLYQIAFNHGLMIILLVVIMVLQILAQRQGQRSVKKNL